MAVQAACASWTVAAGAQLLLHALTAAFCAPLSSFLCTGSAGSATVELTKAAAGGRCAGLVCIFLPIAPHMARPDVNYIMCGPAPQTLCLQAHPSLVHTVNERKLQLDVGDDPACVGKLALSLSLSLPPSFSFSLSCVVWHACLLLQQPLLCVLTAALSVHVDAHALAFVTLACSAAARMRTAQQPAVPCLFHGPLLSVAPCAQLLWCRCACVVPCAHADVNKHMGPPHC